MAEVIQTHDVWVEDAAATLIRGAYPAHERETAEVGDAWSAMQDARDLLMPLGPMPVQVSAALNVIEDWILAAPIRKRIEATKGMTKNRPGVRREPR